MEKQKRKVIIVTDGDNAATRTIRVAASNINARFISLTSGNPTPLMGSQVIELIKMAPHDPVIVMADDRGECGRGKGETIIQYLSRHEDIEIIGVIAVASNTCNAKGVPVDESVTRDGEIIHAPVKKTGEPEKPGHKYLEGDTVEILSQLKIPFTVGIGDIGKMDYQDDYRRGAPITTKALQEIISHAGLSENLDK